MEVTTIRLGEFIWKAQEMAEENDIKINEDTTATQIIRNVSNARDVDQTKTTDLRHHYFVFLSLYIFFLENSFVTATN